MPDKIFVFDFDSTLTSVEALEELAAISLAKQPNKDAVIKQIEDITNMGVNGEISFTQSLAERVDLLKANRAHLPELVKRLSKKYHHPLNVINRSLPIMPSVFM
ncbi:MAG: hypothetical protein M0D57_13420 [Sphingobacteriales bacterium JAD_PAG50586_3]|nr:MAG: hypothetical protein M0D57_13420 [Sphingobacteriales bacterium JAD_PAG50586_3]